MKPVISVIIPVLNEQAKINALTTHLRTLACSGLAEIIVVDGDSKGGTLSVIRDAGAVKIKSPKGRGVQLAAGAEKARGELLLFLHADTFLPASAFTDILSIRNDTSIAASAWDLSINHPGPVYKIIGKTASLRSRLSRIPYGDQGLCVKREWYDRIGGMRPFSVMEDVDFALRLKRKGGKVLFFKGVVRTSPRRWEKEGVLVCTLRNWVILGLFFFGVGAGRLEGYYGDHDGCDDRMDLVDRVDGDVWG